jgi:(4-alkanoyl-5-oxo-2,5-dihydrofuran-3-yl)methyl phosphate reductase
VPFTFVQPTGFMSNLLAWAPSIKTEGIVRSSTLNGRRAFIHSDDIAAVALAALTTRAYDRQSLPITGPEALSFPEVTTRIGRAIRRQLTFQPISDEEARQRYSGISGSEEETEAHVALWRAIREGRLANANDNVRRIVGRNPIGLEQWLVENAGKFR